MPALARAPRPPRETAGTQGSGSWSDLFLEGEDRLFEPARQRERDRRPRVAGRAARRVDDRSGRERAIAGDEVKPFPERRIVELVVASRASGTAWSPAAGRCIVTVPRPSIEKMTPYGRPAAWYPTRSTSPGRATVRSASVSLPLAVRR
jgi:hypothetical protein